MTNNSYLLAFADSEGEVYAIHPSDDLDSYETWEFIDFKFSLPGSIYILIWRGDRKKFSKNEASQVTKYVRDDMEDFISDGDGSSDWHCKIVRKLANDDSCLVLAWDRMILPDQFSSWKEFVELSYQSTKDMSKKISQPGSIYERELDIYTGRIHDKEKSSPFKAIAARSNKFVSIEIPSEEVIKQYVSEMLLENYAEANILLSSHYEVFPATLSTEISPQEKAFVYYDWINHMIFLSLDKLPDLSLRIPALLLGFFRHLAEMKSWKFDNDVMKSMVLEKQKAEDFAKKTIERMLDLGIDPR